MLRTQRRHAVAHGVEERVRFETSEAKRIDERGFDCLHDMGDPRGWAAHMREILRQDGTWMIVESVAGNRPIENMTPVGRLYYNASTIICVPTSLDQEAAEGLGAQAGEEMLAAIVKGGGLTGVGRAAQGPFNMALEARL